MQITPGNSHAPCMWPLLVAPARDPCTWPHPVIPIRGFCAAQLNLWSWVNWTLLHDFAKNATYSERRRSVVSARDVSRDFFRSRWASLDQPSVFVTRLTILHLTNKCHSIRSIRFIQPIALISGLHLCNSRSSTSRLVLKLAPNRANQ